MKAVVFTLGCKVNSCESASLATGLKQVGWEVSDKLEYADLYIINTCAVTAEAEKKSRQAVARVSKYNPDARIIITGCASQKSPDSFLDKNNVSLITGARNKDKIIDMLTCQGVCIDDDDAYFERFLPEYSSRTRTYIKVQDGCDNFCSYCIIPYLRGIPRSRDPVSVKKEIIHLNPLEVVLTGINLSRYHFNGMGLTELLIDLRDVSARIRLGSLELCVIDEEFLKATKELKDFAPHFHLSLQSGSDNVLNSMNRKYTTGEYFEKVQLIRNFYPNCAITTDIIVGFSTENISDFNQTLSFVKKVEFSDIHCFIYSKREGTEAAKLKELPYDEKKKRLNQMLEVKNTLRKRFLSCNVGSVAEFIPEDIEGEYTVGYTGNYIKVYVKGNYVSMGKSRVVLDKLFNEGILGHIEEV